MNPHDKSFSTTTPSTLSTTVVSNVHGQEEFWRQSMRSAISSLDALLAFVELQPADVASLNLDFSFPLRVPLSYARRIRKGDPRDPLLRQVLPWDDERQVVTGFVRDPLREQDKLLQPGLIQKYQGRVLVITTGSCAVHCRYCFRRHFPYGSQLGQGARQAILDHIRADTSIHEVILSGGDPLSLSTARLADWLHALSAITHVRRIRLHTRMPVVMPDRIDEALLRCLSGEGAIVPLKPIVIVLHANHPNEIGPEVMAACEALHHVCHSLWNQAVLLGGVNDDVDTLVALSERLFDVRVLPYYLNLLDEVAGAHGYQVPLVQGRALTEALRRRLPGYLCPRVVKEQSDQLYKVPIESIA